MVGFGWPFFFAVTFKERVILVDTFPKKSNKDYEGRRCPKSLKKGEAIMKNKKPINNILLALCLFVFQAVAFAEDYHVHVVQNIAIPGSVYAVDASSALIPYSKVPGGKLNLRYNFDLYTDDEDSDNEFIRCVVKIPETDFKIIAFDGVQTFKSEEKQISAISERYDYAEFLIPVREAWKGFVEIQMTIPSEEIGADLPVDISFYGHKRTKSSYLPFTSKSVQDMVSAEEITSGEDAIEYVKSEYNPFSMSSSVKHYTIQVVR